MQQSVQFSFAGKQKINVRLGVRFLLAHPVYCRVFLPISTSDVNKDLTFKDKDQTYQDKDQTPKDKDQTFKAKDKD